MDASSTTNFIDEARPHTPRTTFLSLPDEILENIADHLDGFSRVAYALCSHRLQRATTYQENRLLEIENVEQGFNNMLPVGFCVRSLDLSHQYKPKEAIEGVILECSQLRELNIVNANLSFPQLMNILDNLELLEVLSFSMPSMSPDCLHERHVSKAQSSIRKLFVDCAPSVEVFLFLARFLNGCKRVEYVHLNFVAPANVPREPVKNPFPQRSPRWRTLHTIVGSFHLCNAIQQRTSIALFLDFSEHTNKRRACWTRQDSAFVPFSWLYVEVNSAHEVIVTENIEALDAEHFRVPSAVFSPALSAWFSLPKNVVELDLTMLPCAFPGRGWRTLTSSAPNLKTLACHICLLPKGEDFSSVDADKLSRQSYVIDCLEKLRLTKLHLLAGRERYTDSICMRCHAAGTSYILGNLDRLRYLEELTLAGVIPSPIVYENIANSNVRVMKLSFRAAPLLAGLYEMLQFCKRLRYFRFGAPDLPLHSPLLWAGLSARDSLKQLCLASSARGEADLDMVRSSLHTLTQCMEVFHFHAENLPEVYNVIAEHVRTLNREKPYRNLMLLPPETQRVGDVIGDNASWRMPGRNLCCLALLVGKMELKSWTDF